jgi:UV DNA damage repair endonuclease
MIVRFGFVAMSMQIKNASPSKNMTEKTLKRIGNRGLAAKKVIRLAKETCITRREFCIMLLPTTSDFIVFLPA